MSGPYCCCAGAGTCSTCRGRRWARFDAEAAGETDSDPEPTLAGRLGAAALPSDTIDEAEDWPPEPR